VGVALDDNWRDMFFDGRNGPSSVKSISAVTNTPDQSCISTQRRRLDRIQRYPPSTLQTRPASPTVVHRHAGGRSSITSSGAPSPSLSGSSPSRQSENVSDPEILNRMHDLDQVIGGLFEKKKTKTRFVGHQQPRHFNSSAAPFSTPSRTETVYIPRSQPRTA
jgi:hypothetical protein